VYTRSVRPVSAIARAPLLTGRVAHNANYTVPYVILYKFLFPPSSSSSFLFFSVTLSLSLPLSISVGFTHLMVRSDTLDLATVWRASRSPFLYDAIIQYNTRVRDREKPRYSVRIVKRERPWRAEKKERNNNEIKNLSSRRRVRPADRLERARARARARVRYRTIASISTFRDRLCTRAVVVVFTRRLYFFVPDVVRPNIVCDDDDDYGDTIVVRSCETRKRNVVRLNTSLAVTTRRPGNNIRLGERGNDELSRQMCREKMGFLKFSRFLKGRCRRKAGFHSEFGSTRLAAVFRVYLI